MGGIKMELKVCPKCGGDISLYPQCYPREDGNNCFAHCNKCHTEFIVAALLIEEAIYKDGLLVGVRHTDKSIKKARNEWNKLDNCLIREHPEYNHSK